MNFLNVLGWIFVGLIIGAILGFFGSVMLPGVNEQNKDLSIKGFAQVVYGAIGALVGVVLGLGFGVFRAMNP